MSDTPDTPRSIRILHLEDSDRDAEIIQDTLEGAGLACDVTRVESRTSLEVTLVEDMFDLVISDFNLPDIDGLTALRLIQDRCPHVPVIVVSGAIDPTEAVRVLQEGATDYVLKQRLERLPSAVTRACAEAEHRRQRQEWEARLLESEERFRQLAEHSREGFWFVSLHPERILYVNQAVQTIWGLSAERFYQDPRVWLGAVHADDRLHMQDAWEAWATDRGPHFEVEHRVVRPDGSVRWVWTTGTRIRDSAGAITRLSGLTQDITERKELEAQFHQSQKMESIGQLAGGIAHDFNNVLTVINGVADLALSGLSYNTPLRADLEEIRKAGDRAAALTRQLLAFSRKQILEPRVLSLATVVAGTEKMLRRLVGENIHIVVKYAADVAHIRADAGQLEQVLVNLVVNARDAMPHGGTLTIETGSAEHVHAAGSAGVVVPPGRYTMLAVSDTGVGMDDATRRRIFEPFYTTKDPGQGTGLGLSTVHGIVAQSGGAVTVHSEVGHGTAFKVYLPQVTEAAAVEEVPEPGLAPALGTETILLAEDNGPLRRLATRILVSAGYTVLTASSGPEALATLESSERPVQMLLTDMVMPGMDGAELACRARGIYPGLKVVYATGYSDEALLGRSVLAQATPSLVRKPFTAAELTRKVRQVLDSSS